jgi:hypothetical protein
MMVERQSTSAFDDISYGGQIDGKSYPIKDNGSRTRTRQIWVYWISRGWNGRFMVTPSLKERGYSDHDSTVAV